LLLVAAGCSGPVVNASTSAMSRTDSDGTTTLAVEAVRVDRQVRVVVAANRANAAGTVSGGGVVEGRFSTPEGSEVLWSCGFSREESGVIINGKPFDLSQGGLFLIDTRTAPAAVEQLKLDPADLELGSTTLGFEQLAKDEPRVAAFLEKCKEAKMP